MRPLLVLCLLVVFVLGLAPIAHAIQTRPLPPGMEEACYRPRVYLVPGAPVPMPNWQFTFVRGFFPWRVSKTVTWTAPNPGTAPQR